MSDLKTRIKKAVKHPKYAFLRLVTGNHFEWMSDEDYLKMIYQVHFDNELDLEHPKTFNEKLQWLKLHDRKPEYTNMVDKFLAKKYVADIIGEEYIIPTLGKYDKFDDIDFDKLPNQFVLKCNHDSGSVVVVKDKSKFDDKARAAAKKKLDGSLKRNYFWIERGWAYKNIVPCIIAEKYMEDSAVTEQEKPFNDLRDYKFFCFDGKVECFKIDFDRFINHRANYFDKNGKLLPFGEVVCPPDFDEELHIPEQLTEMVNLAEKLSAGKSFVRVDFYCNKNKFFFGELTFYPAGGMGKFVPEKRDEKLGKLITIPDVNGGGYAVICNGFVLWLHEEQSRADGLVDYKFYCFNGEPKFLYVGFMNMVKGEKHDQLSFLDLEWKPTPFYRKDHEPFPFELKKPLCFEQMIDIAKKLSQNTPFARIDMFCIDGKIYFSEVTFYPGGGYGRFYPDEWEEKLGEWIRLSE